jgi:hypothetical protein
MRTILIAQRDVAFAEQLAIELREAGYRAIVCTEPLPSAERCARRAKSHCPPTEDADLMIDDPQLRTCKTISSGFLGTSGQVVGWRRVPASMRRVTN